MPRGLYSKDPPNNTRPNSMVEGRGILENRSTLPWANPDFIDHFKRAKGMGIIEGSPRVVVRKDPKYETNSTQ